MWDGRWALIRRIQHDGLRRSQTAIGVLGAAVRAAGDVRRPRCTSTPRLMLVVSGVPTTPVPVATISVGCVTPHPHRACVGCRTKETQN